MNFIAVFCAHVGRSPFGLLVWYDNIVLYCLYCIVLHYFTVDSGFRCLAQINGPRVLSGLFAPGTVTYRRIASVLTRSCS
jgi:hypothetical protein